MPIPPLSIDSEMDAGGATVRIAGDLDVATERRLLDYFDTEVPTGWPIAIDLSRVGFIDSRGLNSLVRAVQSLRSRGTTARVVDAAPQARELFELTGLDRLLMGGSDGGSTTGP